MSLFDRSKKRYKNGSMIMFPVKSAFIFAIGHDAERGILTVQTDSRQYHYTGFSSELFEHFLRADSIDEYYHNRIKPNFPVFETPKTRLQLVRETKKARTLHDFNPVFRFAMTFFFVVAGLSLGMYPLWRYIYRVLTTSLGIGAPFSSIIPSVIVFIIPACVTEFLLRVALSRD